MPIFQTRAPAYKASNPIEFEWDTFRGGLNTLLGENEISKNELTQAENILLIGKGIPTKRWGTALYHQAGNATGSVRGLKGYYLSTGTVELLALTDDGFLTKKSGASYSTLTGASWASGYDAYMAQLDDSIYIVNGQRELVRYSLPTLVGFPTIGVPTGLGASNLSNATGTNTYSYRVTAVSTVGETTPSTPKELSAQPQIPGGTAGGTVRVAWSAVSTASGVLAGYNIYGRTSGSERFLGFVDSSSTSFLDTGLVPSEFTFAPTADSTGGPKAKYIKRFEDRLIFAGLDGQPSRLLISGRVPNHEKFDIANGGNFLEIEPDSGDDITQIEIFGNRIVVFKSKSIWEVTLSVSQVGNFFITEPSLKLITATHGCIASRSVTPVENDIFFLSRDGVKTLGYESGFAVDVLRTNEVSVKVRNFFRNLTVNQKMTACAVYNDFKYIVTFPGLSKTMIFDRERLAWLGPWTNDARLFEVFYDSSGNSHLLYGNDTNVNVDEYSENFTDDKGSAISTILRTRQEDFGDWSSFKTVKDIFTQFQNITGEVNVDIRLEQRNGSVVSAKSATITPNTGNSGWGADIWATALFGDSATAGGGVDAQQIIRWFPLNKAARAMQMTIRTTGLTANYELLGIRGNAKKIGSGFRPSSWRVT